MVDHSATRRASSPRYNHSAVNITYIRVSIIILCIRGKMGPIEPTVQPRLDLLMFMRFWNYAVVLLTPFFNLRGKKKKGRY
jgi:hypothetical protein